MLHTDADNPKFLAEDSFVGADPGSQAVVYLEDLERGHEQVLEVVEVSRLAEV